MATRQTRKAGIMKPRLQDKALQKTLDAIIERLEVMDGIRGDFLDSAVTFRSMQDAGFEVGELSGISGSTTGSGTGSTSGGAVPGTGPTTPPTALQVNETFLALLVEWTNPPFNLQYIEIWRNTVDNLSTATLIGTTPRTRYIDYVGANASYYYWARGVATDGTTSAYNDTAGTLGTTGIDPSDIEIGSGNFIVTEGGYTDLAPFVVGTVNGVTAIGLQGQFIVDGTIRANSIIAGSIGAREIFVENLSVISADMGTITAGLFRTAPSPAFRVEIEDQVSTAYPIWYGSGAKSAANGLFYVDQNGSVIMKGLLDAGMIKQSFFTPVDDNNSSFRIACEYPSAYSGGEYTGRAAHLNPTLTTGYRADSTSPTNLSTAGFFFRGEYIDTTNPPSQRTIGWYTDYVTVYSPTYTGHTVEYGRLGTLSEQLILRYGAAMSNEYPGREFWAAVFYRYDSEVERCAWIHLSKTSRFDFTIALFSEESFVTREDPWDVLSIRLGLGSDNPAPGEAPGYVRAQVQSVYLTLKTANFGYADLEDQLVDVTSTTSSGTAPEPYPGDLYRYL